MVEVTQAENKIARAVFSSAGPAICEALEYGACEETAIFSIAQIVARHRTASTAALTAERDALAARVEVLDRVARFARHTVSCGLYNEDDECTCGLDAARKALTP
jgi:hypothetical protein